MVTYVTYFRNCGCDRCKNFAAKKGSRKKPIFKLNIASISEMQKEEILK